MEKKELPSIARTVENTIQSLLMFGVKYVTTVGILIMKPHRVVALYRREKIRRFPRFVYPITFLSFSFFFVAILVNLYVAETQGSERLYFDMVFITAEVLRDFTEQINNSPSVIKVFLTALPGVSSIYLLSYFIAVFLPAPHRMAFIYALFYSFGFQCIVLFLLVLTIFFAQEQLFLFDRWNNTVIDSGISWSLLLYSLLHPAIVIISTVRAFVDRKVTRLVLFGISPLAVILFPFTYYWAAATVPLVTDALYPKAEETFSVAVQEQYAYAEGSYDVILLHAEITNELGQSVYIDTADFSFQLANLPGDTSFCRVPLDYVALRDVEFISEKGEILFGMTLPHGVVSHWKIRAKTDHTFLLWSEEHERSTKRVCVALEFGDQDFVEDMSFEYSRFLRETGRDK